MSLTRRAFLGDLGIGTFSWGVLDPGRLLAAFGRAGGDDALEALVRRMQTEAPDALLAHLAAELKRGVPLRTLVVAGALANARTFAGHDYEGFHAFMALRPALAMSARMPAGLEALPVLKVLYRNTARIRAAGERRERLTPVAAKAPTKAGDDAFTLRRRVQERDLDGAESCFAWHHGQNPETARQVLHFVVEDDADVHRVVLADRAHDMASLAGPDHGLALLRQVVRYCIDQEHARARRNLPVPALRTDLPAVVDRHRLLARKPGDRVPDAGQVEQLADVVFGGTRADAADAAAALLAAGFAPAAVAEALVQAATRLLLHDTGERRVHGASLGVHACDAAHAWRNLAQAGSARTSMTSVVAGAWHTAGQSERVGREPYAFADELGRLAAKDPDALLRAAQAAIEQRDQRGACAALQRYGELGHAAEPAFALLLRYAVSEDGALHAEKFFHTVREEFARTRSAFRWRLVVALARVTASEFGEPAPGVAAARQLLAT
jgi:hypothetical protein